MKSKFNGNFVPILTLLFALFIFTNVVEAQEKSKKQLKEEKKLDKQKQIALLVESKEFVFVADRVMPQSGRAINLTTVYNVDFHPEWIKSDLPFFGRAFSGVGYGGDEGMKFEGKPTLFQVEKTKKGHQIKAEVRGNSDFYSMNLSVYSDGNAYLTINSNNRSTISYDGEIQVFKKS
jgi:hypothetical protein